MGFEIELLAPAGSSRKTLAAAVAERCGGTVCPFLFPQSEPSLIRGQATFENLTLGFQVLDSQGRWLANFVDDLTLQKDLDKSRPPKPGWFRIVSDDKRLMQLFENQCDLKLPPYQMMENVAGLFGVQAERADNGAIHIADRAGASIAIYAQLPGERERPCEIVTAPIEDSHYEKLGFILQTARDHGFSIPHEGATHIHFDGARLKSSRTIQSLVIALTHFSESIEQHCRRNPNCTRLGPWPRDLFAAVCDEDFATLTWSQAANKLSGIGLTKFCDHNLVNLISGNRHKPTFEARALGSTLDAEYIINVTSFYKDLLERCIDQDFNESPLPPNLDQFIGREQDESTVKCPPTLV